MCTEKKRLYPKGRRKTTSAIKKIQHISNNTGSLYAHNDIRKRLFQVCVSYDKSNKHLWSFMLRKAGDNSVDESA